MKISFRVFSPVSWLFSSVSWVFPPEKKIKINTSIKKQRTSSTEHFFSPGSSTRILSEYLKIWIKSLSAWVFSFRRRLIFEVRLKFRPFARYRYIHIIILYILYIFKKCEYVCHHAATAVSASRNLSWLFPRREGLPPRLIGRTFAALQRWRGCAKPNRKTSL